MIAAMRDYPPQESVGVWFTVLLLGFLVFGAVVAWAAGRPERPRRRGGRRG